MALPSNVDYGTVVGQFLLAYADSNDVDLFPDGVPAKGSVFFDPSPVKLLDALSTPNPVTIMPATVEAQLDADGYILGYAGERGVRLVATDDADLNPQDWTWKVTFRLTDQNDVPVQIADFSFELPAGTTVDLTTVSPVPDANGTYYLVGPTGPANQLSVGTVTTLDAGENATVDITGSAPSQTIDFGVPKGDAATVDVGATSTVTPSDPATVTNSGDTTNAVFDFEIPQGEAATVDVGTTTTGAEGTSASVTNSGTTAEAVFDFTIPKGDTGDTGPQGDAATITVGSTTTGSEGTNASVTNSGTTGDAILDFTIPVGDTGPQGPQGDAATIAVGSVTTVDPTEPATITNSGTSGSAIFNFEIPQGETGSLAGLSATSPITYSNNTIGLDETAISEIDGGSA